jgi:hypothetical protein
MTLYVNLFGGPSCGKSTTAAGLSWVLRKSGRSVEYITEVAKQMVWEGNTKTLSDQLLIFAMQRHQERIVRDKVDIAITDSPTFLSLIYDQAPSEILRRQLSDLILTDFRSKHSLNLMLKRVTRFDPAGRLHNEQQSIAIDHEIMSRLSAFGIRYHLVEPDRLEFMETLIDRALCAQPDDDEEVERPTAGIGLDEQQ